MHQSLQIWGWFLPKKNWPPHPRGGRSGNFRGSKNQKSGKCHELSRKSINLFLPIPPGGVPGGGGGWGLKFKKSGKFHELSRKSIKKNFTPPPTKGGRSGNFRGSKNQKSGKCHELSRIQFVFTHPTRGGVPGGGGLGGSKFQKVRSISWTVEKIDKKKVYPPPLPPKGVAVGILGGQKSRKCHELPRKVITKN